MTDGYFTIAQATRLFPKVGERYISRQSLWRYISRGIRGEFLRVETVGGRTVVSAAEVRRFQSALNRARFGEGAARRAELSVRRGEAQQILEEYGI